MNSTANTWGGGDADTAFWFMEGDAFLQFSLPSPNNPQIMVCHSPS